MDQEKPPFDEDAELFKLQVLSDFQNTRYFTWLVIWTGLLVAYWVFLVEHVPDIPTQFLALGLGGLPVIIMFLLLSVFPKHRETEQMSEYLEQIKGEHSLPTLIELYEKDKRIWRWLRSRGEVSKTKETDKKRGLGFFLVLAVTLWFTGFFAWSQTVIWQSVLSDIARSSSTSGIETIAMEGIVETLIVSALFGFYLWLAYGLSSAYREVFDGLFGIRKREMETKKEENGKGAV